MKTSSTILLLLIFLCSFQWANAQGKIGIRAGVLISKQEFKQGNLDVNPKSKFGADLALIAEFGGEVVAFSPEFHWIQKGSKIEDINGGFNEASQTFNYLEVPLLLKLKFGTDAGFFFFAGPSIGYLFGADADGDGAFNEINLSDYKRAEIGAHIGGGLTLGPVNVDVRYILGISNIADYEGSDLEIKNSGFGGGVSFIF